MNPTFIMMVGLPYSGKSYYAEKLSKEYGAVVYSSDAIRAEILGDVQDQNNNGKVFEVLHRRVYDDLSNGKSVIYDATNINYKRRMDTIQRLKRIPCEKVCYLMATPFSECVERSKYRDRVVPYEVLACTMRCRIFSMIWLSVLSSQVSAHLKKLLRNWTCTEAPGLPRPSERNPISSRLDILTTTMAMPIGFTTEVAFPVL